MKTTISRLTGKIGIGVVVVAALWVARTARADTFGSWGELVHSGCFVEGVDYDVLVQDLPDNRLVLAIHGGGIEVETDQLAMDIALGGFSSYWILDGHVQAGVCGRPVGTKQNADLHITSDNFDHPGAEAMVQDRYAIVSLHGMADRHEQVDEMDNPLHFPQYAICVGGNNLWMRMAFVNAVRGTPLLHNNIRVIDAGDPLWDGHQAIEAPDDCTGLFGLSWNNIVNDGPNPLGGLQLEMSRSLRRALYNQDEDGDAPGPWGNYDAIRMELVAVIQDVIAAEDAFW